MKRLFILLVFILTASALCAQHLPPVRQRNTKPKGNRNAHSYYGTSVVYQRTPADSTGAPVAEQVQQAIDTVPAGSSAIKASSAPCESAPKVTFAGKELTLDCENTQCQEGGGCWSNYHLDVANLTPPSIHIQWLGDWLKNYGGGTERDNTIKHWKTNPSHDQDFQVYGLSGGNAIVSGFSETVAGIRLLTIQRTFDQGSVSFILRVPQEMLNNKAKLDEWRSQMETEAVDWLIPTPYK